MRSMISVIPGQASMVSFGRTFRRNGAAGRFAIFASVLSTLSLAMRSNEIALL